MKQNRTLNDAFPIVAAALGNKLGVKVKVGGSQASTDGKTITLPAYNLDEPYYKEVAWGYLAHEAGHVRFSDFNEFTNAATRPIRKGLVNILEDIRIEKLMVEMYPGAKFTLEKMDEMICHDGQFAIVGQQSHPAAILSQFLFLRLSTDVLGFSGLSNLADKVEAILEATFPVGAVTRLMGLLSEVPLLKSTRDCVRLTDRILRMLEDEQEKAQAQEQENDRQSPAGQPEQDSPMPSLGLASNADGSASDGQGQPDPGNTDVTDRGDCLSQDPVEKPSAPVLAAVLDAAEQDLPDDRSEWVKSVLGGQQAACYDADVHLPVAMAPKRHEVAGQALLDKVLVESGKLRASLQGLVQASQNRRPVHKASGNRIDGRKLSRLATGDARVFVRNQAKRSPNTAIHLLVDGSGSMSAIPDDKNCRPINLAMEAAMALALAMDAITGVNLAVTRFPYGDTDDVVPLLRHGQKVRSQASAFLPITDGGTPLHSALWYAAAALLSTREQRKIIMVLTDGQPDDVDATRAIIRRCEATGIELVGVGIFYDTGHLFRRSTLINDLSGLRSGLFGISRDVLLAA